jgi:hypothetical protein
MDLRLREEEDSYYSGGVSHWDHATNGGGASVAVVAAVVAFAIASAFLVTGLSRRRWSGQRTALGIVAYAIAFYAAFFFLTTGH